MRLFIFRLQSMLLTLITKLNNSGNEILYSAWQLFLDGTDLLSATDFLGVIKWMLFDFIKESKK